jgi:hypothetical protein
LNLGIHGPDDDPEFLPKPGRFFLGHGLRLRGSLYVPCTNGDKDTDYRNAQQSPCVHEGSLPART